MYVLTSLLLAFRLGGPYQITPPGASPATSVELRYHTCYEDGNHMTADAYYPAVAGTRFKVPLTSPQDSIVLDSVGMAVAFNFIPNNYQDSIQIYQDGNGSPDTYLATLYFSFSAPTPGGALLQIDLGGALSAIKPTAGDSIVLWLVSPNQVSGTDSLLVGLDTTTQDTFTSKINFVSEDNGPWVDIYTVYHVGNDWGFTLWYTLYTDVSEEPIPSCFAVRNIHPNPAREGASLSFSTPGPTNAQVALYDASGRKVKEVFHGDVDMGWHETSLDTQGLSPGTYLVRVSTDFGTETKVLLVR